MDERITLRHTDKIPYGTAVAKTLLPSLFPSSAISFDKKPPGYWDSVNAYGSNQAVVLVADYFNADEEELERLLYFVKEGNYVFIISHSFSYDVAQFFNFSCSENFWEQDKNGLGDSLRIQLEKPVFNIAYLFTYPGKKYESSFYSLDTLRTKVLGRTENNHPDFIQLYAGKGSVFIHTAPLAFSNYFILHKKNIKYVEKALSVIPPDVDNVLWNEYFLIKPRQNNQKEPNWFRVLLQYPAFKWGLLTGLATLLLFVLSGMRRKQRMIPLYKIPANDSLDFIKTLGRLYYDKKNHKNLAKKMAIYFLDHVRTRYKLAVQTIDEEFVQTLHYKSGYPLAELKQVTDFISYLDEVPAISEKELSAFHKQVELFYQNT